MSRYDDEAPGGSAVPWFLFGIGLGAALGLLFAPQSGEETRRAIGKKVRKLKDLAEDKFDDLSEAAGKQGRRLRDAMGDVAAEFGEDGDEEPAPSRAREELERRLSAARARRRGAPAPMAATDSDDGEHA